MQKRLNYPSAQEGVADTIRISGNFTTNGTSDPTVKSTGPWSVARIGVGQLRVTFKENVVEILSQDAVIIGAGANTQQAKPITGSSVGTNAVAASIVIETQSAAGTAADLTGPVVSFDVALRKGRLTK